MVKRNVEEKPSRTWIYLLVVVVLLLAGVAGWWSYQAGLWGGLPLVERYKFSDERIMSYCVGGEGDKFVLWLSTDKGRLYAFDNELGLLWKSDPGYGQNEWVIVASKNSISRDGSHLVAGNIFNQLESKRTKNKLFCYNRSGNIDWVKEFNSRTSLPFISPDGKRIIAWSEGKLVQFYDITGKLLSTYRVNAGEISDIGFAADSPNFAVLTSKAVIFFIKTEQRVISIPREGIPYEHISMNNSGTQVLISGGKNIEVWDKAGKMVKKFEGHRSNFGCFTSRGDSLFMGISYDYPKGELQFYDLKADKMMQSLNIFPPVASYVDTDEAGQYVVFGKSLGNEESDKKNFYLLSSKGEKIWAGRIANADLWPKISLDGKLVAAVADEYRLLLYKTSKEKQ